MRVDATTDADVAYQIDHDEDAPPEFTEDMAAQARWVIPPAKTPISFRVDVDVLEWFKAHGERYQTRMNAVLRSFMQHEQARARRRSGEPEASGRTDSRKLVVKESTPAKGTKGRRN